MSNAPLVALFGEPGVTSKARRQLLVDFLYSTVYPALGPRSAHGPLHERVTTSCSGTEPGTTLVKVGGFGTPVAALIPIPIIVDS